MRLSTKTQFIGLAVLLGILIMVGCGSNAATSASGAPTVPVATVVDIVATVNGQPIMMDAFQRELARYEAGQLALGLQIADDSGYKQQVLDLLIEQELIRQTGASQGVVVTDEEVDTAIGQMIQENGEEYFNGWLTTNYYSREEFREVIRLQILTNRLIEPVAAEVPSATEHVHARHILVNSQTEAEQVLVRLQAGESFESLAAQYSVDVTTRDNGGDLGWFPRGGLLVPEVEDAAFNMSAGQTSGVIPTAWGYHIVQTLEFDPEREVEAATHQRLLEQTIDEWRLDLRNGANIQYLISFTS